jgi:hypothetical protein
VSHPGRFAVEQPLTAGRSGPGRHRSPEPATTPERRVAVLVIAAVALMLAAGISVAAFIAAAADPPPAGTRR